LELDVPNWHIMLIYRDASTTLQVRLDGDTVWLSQRQIAELYQTTPQNITQHIARIYDEGELDEPSTCKDYLPERAFELDAQIDTQIPCY
jgi:hypothetical protein